MITGGWTRIIKTDASTSPNAPRKLETPYIAYLLFHVTFLLLHIAINVSQSVASPSIRVSSLPPAPIHAGDAFEWTITVEWEEAPGANAEVDVQPNLTDLRTINRSTHAVISEKDGRRVVEKSFSYVFEALESGEASIGHAVVVWVSGDEASRTQRLRTNPVFFNVAEPLESASLPYFLMWSTLLLISAAGVTLWTWNRIRKREFDRTTRMADPIQTRINAAFEEAQRRRMEGDFSGFAHAISEAIQAKWTPFEAQQTQPLADLRERLEEPLRPVFDRLTAELRELAYSPETPSTERLDQILKDARRLTDDGQWTVDSGQ